MKQNANAARFFDDFSRAFDTFYDGQRGPFMQWLDRHFRSDMHIRFGKTFEVLAPIEGRSVLDIGCGSGVYSVEALRRGASKVTALDPAPGMLKLVRERMEKAGLAGRCEIVEGLFPQVLPPPHDFAIVMGVMDYVEEPLPFLKALRALVKTSAAVSFPSEHWFRSPIRKVRYRLRNCPVYFYHPQQIHSIGHSAGFSHVDIFKIPGAGMDYHVSFKP